ncbi:hypothetical protein [Armatimonas rosea]|uniref:Uncharacterized protein n=1 Tax=Armatimonas rosea TaxID=685828 RepID=A0A7W9SSZ8_ARMRO|nr:hypothetical protein [Armatimonas rosea]MBB6052302.1 hypothetical protein [Armatimonas rosea]
MRKIYIGEYYPITLVEKAMNIRNDLHFDQVVNSENKIIETRVINISDAKIMSLYIDNSIESGAEFWVTNRDDNGRIHNVISLDMGSVSLGGRFTRAQNCVEIEMEPKECISFLTEYIFDGEYFCIGLDKYRVYDRAGFGLSFKHLNIFENTFTLVELGCHLLD